MLGGETYWYLYEYRQEINGEENHFEIANDEGIFFYLYRA